MESKALETELRLSKDRRLVQLLLQTGLACSVLLMAAGMVVKLVSGQLSFPEVRFFDLLRAGLAPGDRIMGIGIVVLAATPAFRVVALLALWIRERDWRFAFVAGLVMVILALAIAMGGG